MIKKLTRAVFKSTSRIVPMLSRLPASFGVDETQRSYLQRGGPREHKTNQDQGNVIIMPCPPVSKTLLLEGDEFHVSKDGISRTYYKLKSWARMGGKSVLTPPAISLEEHYDLNRARKTFIIRRDSCSGSGSRNVVNLGSPLGAFELKEIDGGVLGTAGTGATTWESSIAMSLFFSSNQHLLRGDVVELGSGVGLAGLLGQMIPTMRSLTLTDGNDEVIEQCRRNLNQVRLSGVPTRVQKLDWYDTNKMMNHYDTVLVSDCCYRYSDVEALRTTMTSLCRYDSQSRIHLFGPINRGALLALVNRLKNERNMHIGIDCLEMTRFRLKAAENDCHRRTNEFLLFDDEYPIASRNVAKFLHVTASYDKEAINRNNSLDGID